MARSASVISRQDCGCWPDRDLPDSKAFRFGRSREITPECPARLHASAMCWTDPAAPVSVETKSVLRIGADTRPANVQAPRSRRLAAGFSFPRTARHLLLPLGCGCLQPDAAAESGSMCGANSAHGPSSSSKSALGSFAEWQQQNMERLAMPEAMWGDVLRVDRRLPASNDVYCGVLARPDSP